MNMYYVGDTKKGTFTGSTGRHFYHKVQHIISLLVWTYPTYILLLSKILPSYFLQSQYLALF